MKTCIALLRGINVGGRGRLAMRDLVAVLEAEGLGSVKTYVQSGNAVFRVPAKQLTAAGLVKLAARLRRAIEAAHGFEPGVVLLPLARLEAVVAANPFPDAVAEPTSLHVNFLMAAPAAPDLPALERLRANTERFRLTDEALYLHAPAGIARSKLAAQAERHIGVPMTGRNWRSVSRVLAFARELETT